MWDKRSDSYRTSFRRPGYLSKEARGFASPPHDGFAFSWATGLYPNARNRKRVAPFALADSKGPEPLESARAPARVIYLQVFQHNEGEGGPHGDAEGETRDQPRDALAIHLPSPLIRWPDLPV